MRLSEGEAARTLTDYAQRHPLAFREITHLMTGKSVEASEEACRKLAETVPMMRFEPEVSVDGAVSGLGP